MSSTRKKEAPQETPAVEQRPGVAQERPLMTMDDVPFKFRPQAERIMKNAEGKAIEPLFFEDLQDKIALYCRREGVYAQSILDSLEQILKGPRFTSEEFVHLFNLLNLFSESYPPPPGIELALSSFEALIKNESFPQEELGFVLNKFNNLLPFLCKDPKSIELFKSIMESPHLTPLILEQILETAINCPDESRMDYLLAASFLFNNKDAGESGFIQNGLELLDQAALEEGDRSVISGACSLFLSDFFSKKLLDSVFEPFMQAHNKSLFIFAVCDFINDVSYSNQWAEFISKPTMSEEQLLTGVSLIARLAKEVYQEDPKDGNYRALFAITELLKNYPQSDEAFKILERLLPQLMLSGEAHIIFSLSKALQYNGIPEEKREEVFYNTLILYETGKKLAEKLGADYQDPEVCLNFAFGMATIGAEKVIALHNEFGIEFFMRYTPHMLDQQYLTRNDKSEKPVLLVSYNKSDYNGAFYEEWSQLEQLSKHYRVIITESGSEDEFYSSLEKASFRYGKIGTLVLGGHGEVSSIQLGKHGEKSTLDMTDYKELRKTRPFFTENPTVVLISCSTGKDEKAIGARLSDIWNARLFAPKEPAALSEFVLTKDGEISSVKYTKEKSEFLQGRELSGGTVGSIYSKLAP